MIPQVSDIFADARVHLGDTAVPGGSLFTDAFLSKYWGNSYRALYRWLDRNANKTLRRSSYFILPPNTSYVTPAGMGILNMGKPQDIYDRGVANASPVTIVAVNAATTGVPPSVDLTWNSHGLSSGAEVVTFGFTTMTDEINGSFNINVVDANTIRLLGCPAVALTGSTDIGSTGEASTGQSPFPSIALIQLFDIESWPVSTQASQLTFWKWESGAFRFLPSSVRRQIRIVYMLSGAPPIDGIVAIDDCLDALALYMAGAAAAAKGLGGKAASLFMRAVGNESGDTTNIKGGAFYELAQIGLQQLTQQRIVIPRYRPKRNTGPYPISTIRRA